MEKKTLTELHTIHEHIKTGYIEYGMYYWIISISVIIGGFFNLAGVGSFIFTIIFFFWLGKGHKKLTETTNGVSDGKKK